MSLALYLDDCAYSHALKRLLVVAGHDVLVPADAERPLTGAADRVHLEFARSVGRAVLTFNAGDFQLLHGQIPDHSGILVVYQDNDVTRDMSDAAIVQAIANLEATGIEIAGGFWVLNAYQWSGVLPG